MRIATGVILLGILLACGCDCAGYHRGLVLLGGPPTAVTGTGADDAAVVAALGTLMTNRVYDTHAYMVYGCTKSNRSRIVNGAVDTYVYQESVDPTLPPPEYVPPVTGTGLGTGTDYEMDFTLADGQQLHVAFIYNVGQYLLFEVRGDNDTNISTSTAPARVTLRGTLAGKPVDLSFAQELSGRANLGYRPYY